MPNKPKRNRKSSNIPEDETKAEKFRRVANLRVPKAIKAIGNIGTLANRRNNEFNEGQVEKIIEALSDSLKALDDRFQAALENKPVAAENIFSL